MEWLELAPGSSITSGPVACVFFRAGPHAVIRLPVPHTNDKGEWLPSHLLQKWVACHASWGTEVELCLLHTLPWV